jgi:hypothetical protein
LNDNTETTKEKVNKTRRIKKLRERKQTGRKTGENKENIQNHTAIPISNYCS